MKEMVFEKLHKMLEVGKIRSHLELDKKTIGGGRLREPELAGERLVLRAERGDLRRELREAALRRAEPRRGLV